MMNESILISVIIPVYNAENYIERCVHSIQENTYKNIEIICVDDGSRDRSFELLSEMQKRDDSILIIRQENQGVSTARNTGLKAARGGGSAL